MLVIFDIDGTLCQTNEVDTECFLASILAVTGIDLAGADWNDYPEVTASAIIKEVLKDRPSSQIEREERAIQEDFLERLASESRSAPARFEALPGAVNFLSYLFGLPGWDIAIATGGWDFSARFKLRTAGFTADGIPLASSSDRSRRTEIIALAAERCGRPLTESVYLGDGHWDLQACRRLGIPLIGIGEGHESLGRAGAMNAFVDYSNPEALMEALQSLRPHNFQT